MSTGDRPLVKFPPAHNLVTKPSLVRISGVYCRSRPPSISTGVVGMNLKIEDDSREASGLYYNRDSSFRKTAIQCVRIPRQIHNYIASRLGFRKNWK